MSDQELMTDLDRDKLLRSLATGQCELKKQIGCVESRLKTAIDCVDNRVSELVHAMREYGIELPGENDESAQEASG